MQIVLSMLLFTLLTFISVTASAEESYRYIILLKNPPQTRLNSFKGSPKDKYYRVRQVMNYRYKSVLKPFVSRAFNSKAVSRVRYLPIVHGFSMMMTPSQAQRLSGFSEIKSVRKDRKIYMDKPWMRSSSVARSVYNRARSKDSLGVGLKVHKVDKLIADGLDIHRKGKIVGIVDTGVDGSHPDLKDKVILFKNLADPSDPTPVDEGTHGTHVAGIIAGGNKSGVQIGVYPGARIVATAALISWSSMLEGLQWILDPDGNPQTADHPFVVNNSWHSGGYLPAEYFRVMQAFKDADILLCFSAGNSGENGLTHPKEFPSTFTSAAIDENGTIASFSSRGPAIYQGQEMKKPEVASLGVDVLSTLPRGKYGAMSGTSMASPFTTGTIALLGTYFPKLSPYVIAEAVRKTAELPEQMRNESEQWSREYGFGVVNVYKAYNYLKNASKYRY